MNKKYKRRGKRYKAKEYSKSFRLLGVNAAGLQSKLSTFKKVINNLKPALFFIEESKFKEEGKFKLENFSIFELTRESRDGGGGLAIGCIKELKPVLARKGNDSIEALTIDISLQKMKIKCVVGYGPQENSKIENKMNFLKYIEEDSKTAWDNEQGFIFHCDGNLWAGPNLIPGDPRSQNKNGKLLEEFLARNPNLVLVNSLPICEGLITRRRIKSGKEEQSILDFFIVCTRVLPYVTKMVIDEKREYILTNYKPAKKGEKAKDSDHFTEYMDIDLKLKPTKPVRKEIFNFQCRESQQTFKNLTSNTNDFSKCFEENEPLLKQIDNWRDVLKSKCQMAFKKIRIRDKKRVKINPILSNLIDRRNKIQQNPEVCINCETRFFTKSNLNVPMIKHRGQSKSECGKCGKTFSNEDHLRAHTKSELEKQIADKEAEENRNKIIKNFKNLSENPENVNIKEVWKLMRKVFPKFKPPVPTAKRNFRGKLVTDLDEIKELLLQEYSHRLRKRPIRPDLGDLEARKSEIFKLQLKLAESTSSKLWNMKDLERALANLKTKKARDNEGYVNEIFKEGIIGTDLKKSLLIMFNKLKMKKIVPEFMNITNLTTVPKKGPLTDLKNERGIFRVDVVRSIFMKLIYNEKYPVIEENISDCQMGGRKGKGCRFNLFIINGIIHEVLKNKNNKPVVLQIFDYAQMFDSMNLEQAMSDIYEAGLKDNNLKILYEANRRIHMAINTPDGLTDRKKIEDIVLQGETFSSLLASVQVDSIGKECAKTGLGYKYKNILPVEMLGLVDDTVCISEAGYKTQMMNAIFNVRTAEKTLQFGAIKCKSMLVGKKVENIHRNRLEVDQWSVEHQEDGKFLETFLGKVQMGQCDQQKYLGFVISNSGNNMANIRSVRNKSFGIIRTILEKLKGLNLRKYYFECGILFLNLMLRSSILYGSEAYYNLRENELRTLERIEESYMRQLIGTTKGCPITQLYLELGHTPARFGIMKLRLYFMKTILEQDSSSRIFKFFNIQRQNPSKTDWVSTCMNNLKELNINLTLKEIKDMTGNKFKEMIRSKCNELAYRYLIKRKGSKGKAIEYTRIQMSEYLQPNSELEIEEQKKIFEMRNKMTDIPANYPGRYENEKKQCICEQSEDMEHIYFCMKLNTTKVEVQYEEIYRGNVKNMKKIMNRFKENMKNREKPSHVIQNCDPPV